MSTRCKGCDRELLMVKRKNRQPDEWEDLCGICRSASFVQYNYMNDHQYVLEHAKDGEVTKPHDCSKF